MDRGTGEGGTSEKKGQRKEGDDIEYSGSGGKGEGQDAGVTNLCSCTRGV